MFSKVHRKGESRFTHYKHPHQGFTVRKHLGWGFPRAPRASLDLSHGHGLRKGTLPRPGGPGPDTVLCPPWCHHRQQRDRPKTTCRHTRRGKSQDVPQLPATHSVTLIISQESPALSVSVPLAAAHEAPLSPYKVGTIGPTLQMGESGPGQVMMCPKPQGGEGQGRRPTLFGLTATPCYDS